MWLQQAAVFELDTAQRHHEGVVGVGGIARSTGLRKTDRPRLRLMVMMIGTAAALMVAHTLEVFVWALAYAIAGAAPAGSDLLYFAFVNCTTLGYGDVTPVQAWRLSGPMTAMNGILMFASAGAPGFSSADRG